VSRGELMDSLMHALSKLPTHWEGHGLISVEASTDGEFIHATVGDRKELVGSPFILLQKTTLEVHTKLPKRKESNG
jgi:hypothetical protein